MSHLLRIKEDVKSYAYKDWIAPASDPKPVYLENISGHRFTRDKRGEPFNHGAIHVEGDYYYFLNGNTFRRDLVENLKNIRDKREVGTTLFCSDEIMRIGKYMVDEFDNKLTSSQFVDILVEVLTGNSKNYGMENFVYTSPPPPPDKDECCVL